MHSYTTDTGLTLSVEMIEDYFVISYEDYKLYIEVDKTEWHGPKYFVRVWRRKTWSYFWLNLLTLGGRENDNIDFGYATKELKHALNCAGDSLIRLKRKKTGTRGEEKTMIDLMAEAYAQLPHETAPLKGKRGL